MKFEQAGRTLDREVAKLVDFIDKKMKPSTRQETAKLLRRASQHLEKLAGSLEKDEPGSGGQVPGSGGGPTGSNV